LLKKTVGGIKQRFLRIMMMKTRVKRVSIRGFTLVEVMLVVSIIGLLAAIGIPSILNAYSKSLITAREHNVTEVEKAKGVLTLPKEIELPGAMALTKNDPFNDSAISNLCAALRISSLDDLTVGGVPITVGDLTTEAYY
jgi:prepilin-type N-terminal cleavage/methylation domain-containing protein